MNKNGIWLILCLYSITIMGALFLCGFATDVEIRANYLNKAAWTIPLSFICSCVAFVSTVKLFKATE